MIGTGRPKADQVMVEICSHIFVYHNIRQSIVLLVNSCFVNTYFIYTRTAFPAPIFAKLSKVR
jgi:hypothetical protein